MQTAFTLAQLTDPKLAEADKILRACVHCGFCTATCPTYVLLGDERDSPRGRIYMIKEMLESGAPANDAILPHIDRCLSCSACMTTCPSSVHYAHLIDQARVHVEKTYRRPWADRLLRALLARVLARPALFRALARLGRPFRRIMGWLPGRLGAMGRLLPARLAGDDGLSRARIFAAEGPRRARMALMTGCVQRALRPEINEATIRLFTRHGVEVVVPEAAGCCGSLAHHLGREDEAHRLAKAAIAGWEREAAAPGGLDAILINASGCGATIKDYGFIFRDDPQWASRAAKIASLARDVSEALPALTPKATMLGQTLPTIAYHSACSLQHGQKLAREPVELLRGLGFAVREPAESHLCCGSAGTYNILQPDLASALGQRKAAALETTGADCIASGNIGCLHQLAARTDLPVLHSVELLDWATGGPKPAALRR